MMKQLNLEMKEHQYLEAINRDYRVEKSKPSFDYTVFISTKHTRENIIIQIYDNNIELIREIN